MASHAFDRRSAVAGGSSKPGSVGPMIFVGLLCALLAFFAVGRMAVHTTDEPMAATPLNWQDSLPTNAAAGAAGAAGGGVVGGDQPILLYFTASWCPPCKIMKAQVLPTQRVVNAAEGYVPVMIDTDDDPITARQFQIASIPTTVILGPDGTVRAREEGLIEAPDFAALLDEHRQP